VFEEVFMRATIPYKVVGGVRFYERKEVKDLLVALLIQLQQQMHQVVRLLLLVLQLDVNCLLR